MIYEADLFDWEAPIKPPFVRGSATSEAAAEKIKQHIGPLHQRILDYLANHPEGATDDQMQQDLDMNPSTQRPRRVELAAAGKIENFDCTRPTSSGRSARVWHIVQSAL